MKYIFRTIFIFVALFSVATFAANNIQSNHTVKEVIELNSFDNILSSGIDVLSAERGRDIKLDFLMLFLGGTGVIFIYNLFCYFFKRQALSLLSVICFLFCSFYRSHNKFQFLFS